MKKRPNPSAHAAALRRHAEEQLRRQEKNQPTTGHEQPTARDATRLVHELQVHQLELEAQNVELQQTHAQVDALSAEKLRQAHTQVRTLLAQYTELYDFAPTAYLTLDREGGIRQVNLTGAHLLGVERDRLANQRFALFLAEGDRRAFSDFLEKVFAGQVKQCCEATLPQADAQPRLVQIAGTRAADGLECRLAVLDITEAKVAQVELHGREEHFRRLIENASDLITVVDEHGLIRYQSPASRPTLGYAPEEMMGRSAFEFVHPDDAPPTAAALQRAVASPGTPVAAEFRLRHQNGHWLILQSVGRRLPGPTTECSIVVNSRDITERRQSEELRAASERSYKSLFNLFGDAIYVQDAEGKFLDVNDGAVAMYGYPRDYFLGKTPEFLSAPGRNDLAATFAAIQRAWAGEPQRFEWWGLRKNGEVFPKEVRIERGTYFGNEALVTIARDITEQMRAANEMAASRRAALSLMEDAVEARKRANELNRALRESEERRSLALEGGELATWDWNVVTGEVVHNERWSALLGYAAAEMIPHISHWETLLHPEDRAQAHAALDRHLQGKSPVYESEHRLRHKSGAWVWVLDKGKVIDRDPAGRPVRACGTEQDITARKQAEAALRDSQSRLSLFFNQSLDGFYFSMLDEPIEWNAASDKEKILDYVLTHQRITEVNDAMLAQYGAPRERLLGRTVGAFFAHDPAEGRRCRRILLEAGRLHVETQERKDDGTPIWIEGDYVCIYDGQHRITGTFGIQRDITERKRAEAALRESEDRYRLLVEESPDSIGIYQDGRLVFVNTTGLRQFGVQTKAELLGRTIDQVLHPEDRETALERLRRRLAGEPGVYPAEVRYLRVDGSVLPMEVSAAPVLFGGKPAVQFTARDITERKQAEAALRESEDRYRQLVEESPDGIGIYQDGKLVFINSTGLRQSRAKKKNEILGRTIEQIVHPDDQADALDRVRRLLAGDTGVYPAETRYLCVDGTVFPGEVGATSILYRGKPALQFIVRDITERKQAEEQLRKLSRAVEQSPASVVITDTTGRIEYVNPKFTQVTGYASEEVLGQNPRLLKSGAHPPEFYRQLWRTIATGGEWHGEFHNRAKNGELYWEAAAISPILDAAGKITHFLAVKENITERKQVEQELQAQRDFAHLVMSTMGQGLTVTNEQGCFEFVNPAYARMTGHSPQELIGHQPREFTTPEYQPLLAAQRERRKQGKPSTYESRLIRADGSVTHALINAVPRWRDGRVVGSIAVITDLTERQQVEQALQRSRQQLEFAIEGSGVGLWDWSLPDGDTVFNQRACEMLGYTLAELSPMSQERWGKLCHPDDLEKSHENLHEHFAGKTAFYECEERLRHKDGHWVWVLDRGRVTARDAQGQPTRMTGTHLDITERKLAEAHIAEQAALLDAANDAIYVRALDHTVTYWNRGAERLYGWTRAEALQRKITELGDHDHEAFAAAHAALLADGSWSGELRKPSKTGPEQIVFCRWTLLLDESGRPKEILAINSDITVAKQLEAQFLRAQRMEGIGALAGGIAHDLNNILAPILMTAPLLRETVSDSDGRALLDIVQNCAQRGADIIKQLLTFARGKPGARIPLPARHLLNEMDKLIRETFPRNIRSSVNAPKDLWPVLGDATQIHQAIMNLCVNARDAMPDGGTLTLTAENFTLDATTAAATPDAKPGDYVRLSATDSGTGIPREHLDRIFDPFFTTKEIGKGTGLGLATVLGIVRGHGGFVRVKSRLGQGTTFELAFPAVREANLAPPAGPVTPSPRGQGELILVVDDELTVRQVIQRSLEKQGYQVKAVAEGREALAFFAQHRAEIKVVLTDMMMPVMDGPTFVRELQKLAPLLPVIGMTGLAERVGVKGLENLELSLLLTKPFGGGELLIALDRVLAASRTAGAPTAIGPGPAATE